DSVVTGAVAHLPMSVIAPAVRVAGVVEGAAMIPTEAQRHEPVVPANLHRRIELLAEDRLATQLAPHRITPAPGLTFGGECATVIAAHGDRRHRRKSDHRLRSHDSATGHIYSHLVVPVVAP